MKNKTVSYSAENDNDLFNSLQNKETIRLMWSYINEIEPEQPILLQNTLPLNKDNMYLDSSDNIEKRINLDGHRGPDFIKNVDILFAGCSQTYGLGVKDGTIWGELVAKHLGFKYNNVSYRGGSVMQIVYNIFNYFEKYGNPKYILCAFPSFARTHVFIDSEILTSAPYNKILEKTYGSDKGPYRAIHLSRNSKYIKLPAKVEEVFPNEHRVWINLMFISMLETYCHSNNIKLLWTTWLDVYEDNNKQMYNKFKNYFKLSDDWDHTVAPDKIIESVCHQDLKDKYENFFHRGTDWYIRNLEVWEGHWGAHTHIHISENFIREMKKLGL
jgi:hypothetical protein